MAAEMRRVGAVHAVRRTTSQTGAIEEWELTLGPTPTVADQAAATQAQAFAEPETDPETLKLLTKQAQYEELLNQRLPLELLKKYPDLS